MLGREHLLGRVSGEHLEAALCVLDVESQDELNNNAMPQLKNDLSPFLYANTIMSKPAIIPALLCLLLSLTL